MKLELITIKPEKKLCNLTSLQGNSDYVITIDGHNIEFKTKEQLESIIDQWDFSNDNDYHIESGCLLDENGDDQEFSYSLLVEINNIIEATKNSFFDAQAEYKDLIN